MATQPPGARVEFQRPRPRVEVVGVHVGDHVAEVQEQEGL